MPFPFGDEELTGTDAVFAAWFALRRYLRGLDVHSPADLLNWIRAAELPAPSHPGACMRQSTQTGIFDALALQDGDARVFHSILVQATLHLGRHPERHDVLLNAPSNRQQATRALQHVGRLQRRWRAVRGCALVHLTIAEAGEGRGSPHELVATLANVTDAYMAALGGLGAPDGYVVRQLPSAGVRAQLYCECPDAGKWFPEERRAYACDRAEFDEVTRSGKCGPSGATPAHVGVIMVLGRSRGSWSVELFDEA